MPKTDTIMMLQKKVGKNDLVDFEGLDSQNLDFLEICLSRLGCVCFALKHLKFTAKVDPLDHV